MDIPKTPTPLTHTHTSTLLLLAILHSWVHLFICLYVNLFVSFSILREKRIQKRKGKLEGPESDPHWSWPSSWLTYYAHLIARFNLPFLSSLSRFFSLSFCAAKVFGSFENSIFFWWLFPAIPLLLSSAAQIHSHCWQNLISKLISFFIPFNC